MNKQDILDRIDSKWLNRIPSRFKALGISGLVDPFAKHQSRVTKTSYLSNDK